MNTFKPFEIVVVNHQHYRHFGEVMSMRTPEGTYMVRRVPGHPGTLDELPEDMLQKKPAGKMRWAHYACVAGRLSFPIDMLRYDLAAPVNFRITDEYPYTEIIPGFDYVDEVMGKDALLIGKVTPARNPMWTHERWRSFGWGIREVKSELLE